MVTVAVEVLVTATVTLPTSDDPGDRGLGREHILRSIDRSLQRLGTDYLDLYFCHREDPKTPLEETMQVMDEIQKAGKIRAWGTSVWSARSLRRAHQLARERSWAAPVVEQPCYNLLQRWIEMDIVPTTQQLGMGIVVWSPMAGGYLSGKYLDGIPEGSRASQTDFLQEFLLPGNIQRLQRFSALASELGTRPAVLALAWAANQPGISSAIMGATCLDQLEENLLAADMSIPEEVARELDQLFPPQRQSAVKRLLRRILGKA
ncbi:MAG: aldo/keto reductase [Planctomycetota bacterium]|jgi:aryl-alcohol dehydrogenase-like predicted oxidoreductase